MCVLMCTRACGPMRHDHCTHPSCTTALFTMESANVGLSLINCIVYKLQNLIS